MCGSTTITLTGQVCMSYKLNPTTIRNCPGRQSTSIGSPTMCGGSCVLHQLYPQSSHGSITCIKFSFEMEEFSLDTPRNRLVKEHVRVLLAAQDKELLAITNILT